MVPSKELFLFKEQTSIGYDYTTAGAASLAGTDLIEPERGSSFEDDRESEEIILCGNGLDQDAAIPGAVPANAKMTFPMTPARNNGTVVGTVEPYWGQMLHIAGFSVGATTGAGVPTKFLYGPINAPTSAGMIWKYSGDLATNASLLEKGYNLLADWKITFDGAKAPRIEFNLKGAYYNIPIDATQPSVTKARISAIGFKGATISFAGSAAYKMARLEISGNQSISHFPDLSQAGGIGNGEIGDRKIKGVARILATKAATADPRTAIINSTEATTQVAWGATTSKIQIDMAYLQITKCKQIDVGGLTGWDLEYQANRNDFFVRINP